MEAQTHHVKPNQTKEKKNPKFLKLALSQVVGMWKWYISKLGMVNISFVGYGIEHLMNRVCSVHIFKRKETQRNVETTEPFFPTGALLSAIL